MPESVLAVTPVAQEERAYTSPVERLPLLLQRADAASGDARRAATSELIAYLGQMSRYPSRTVADLLLRWLDQGALTDLQDSDGQTARAAAAAAVVSMGYPYALEISPDDLDHLRARTAAGSGRGGALAAFLMVAVTCGLSVAQMISQPDGSSVLNGAGVLAAMLASVAGVMSSRPRAAGRRLALIALLISGLVAGTMALSGATALIAPALGAMAAFAMAWPRPRS